MTGQITELAVGLLLPMVIRMVTRPGMSNTAKTVVSLLVCSLAGVGTTWATTGTLTNPADLAGSILTVTMAAQTFYRNVYKPAFDEAGRKKE